MMTGIFDLIKGLLHLPVKTIKPHPNVGFDRGERAYLEKRMRAQSRHVGMKRPKWLM